MESPGALRDADEIAAIDGVDVLFVGPADLSHSLGVPGQFRSPPYQEALRAVVAACHSHGKAAGILLYDTPRSRHLELGFTFVGLGADASFVAASAPTHEREPELRRRGTTAALRRGMLAASPWAGHAATTRSSAAR